MNFYLVFLLDNQLRQAEQKVKELDKEQIALIDMLEMERTQRQEEEDRLNKSLMVYIKFIYLCILIETVRDFVGNNKKHIY